MSPRAPVVVAALAVAALVPGGTGATPAECSGAHLKLTARVTDGKDSLRAILTLTNTGTRSCPLPVAPLRLSIVAAVWRNWCSVPRGRVRLAFATTLSGSVSPRSNAVVGKTPPCVDRRYSSRVAVSRFIARG